MAHVIHLITKKVCVFLSIDFQKLRGEGMLIRWNDSVLFSFQSANLKLSHVEKCIRNTCVYATKFLYCNTHLAVMMELQKHLSLIIDIFTVFLNNEKKKTDFSKIAIRCIKMDDATNKTIQFVWLVVRFGWHVQCALDIDYMNKRTYDTAT